MEEFNPDLINEVKQNRGTMRHVPHILFSVVKVLPYVFLTLMLLAIIFLIVVGASLVPYYSAVQETYASGKLGQEYLMSAKDDALKLDFDSSTLKFKKAKENFQQAEKSWQVLDDSVLNKMPYFSAQMFAMDQLIETGVHLSDVFVSLSEVGNEVFAQDFPIINFAKLTTADKQEILSILYKNSPKLALADKDMQIALVKYDNFLDKNKLWFLEDKMEPMQEQIYVLADVIGKARTASIFLPEFLGYNKERVYLFLLLNNSEMRPGGGFLGTYGIVKVQAADLKEFFTDNIYNLDKLSEGKLEIPSYPPMAKYMNQDLLFMRDANWSPDFPASVAKVKELYKLEGGTERFDGVLAITPTVIEDLLGLVGEIEVQGMKFNEQNFLDTLQNEVEFGYVKKGVEFAERKSIIGDLGDALQEKLFALPFEQWVELANILNTNFVQKQVMLNFEKTNLQNIADEYNWSGRIYPTEMDYFMVADANLAALKTDPYVKKSYSYNLFADKKAPEAELKLNYKHEGHFSLLVTRYRSWTRVYLPKDVEVLDVLVDGKKTEVETGLKPVFTDELGKKSIGFFLNVEPQTEKTVVVKYRFSDAFTQRLKKENYKLMWQKQLGLPEANLHLDLSLPYNISAIPQVGSKVGPNRLIYQHALNADLEIEIGRK